MAEELTGLAYFKASDAWKDAPQFADWEMIDLWVEQGKMTPDERDLLHAAGSMAVLNANGSFPEIDAAWNTYHKLDDDADAEKLDPYDDVDYGGPGVNDPVEFDNKGIKGPPDVPPGSEVPPGQTIAVSTEAMKTFTERIGMLDEPMVNCQTLLGEVKIEPGGFAEAWELENKIETDETGLVPATQLFVGKVRDNLVLVTEACKALSAKYTNSEEFNTLTGDKLNTFVGNLRTGLTDMGGQGTTPPPA